MVLFSEDGSWTKPLGLKEGEEPLVLVTHDESTSYANDGKRRIWKEKGKSPLRPTGRGKGIMVSEFLTPIGRLRVPDCVPDAHLLQDPNWPLDENQKPRRYCTEFLEYGKDNYWDGDKVTDQTVNLATRIFPYAYPGCQALFAFDNASNHGCFAEDALLAKKMNLGVGGKQPCMREGYNSAIQQPQSMIFPEDHSEVLLRGKPKGLKQILIERGLWRNRASDGRAFLLECPTSHNRPGCDLSLEGNCCARAVMSKQPDFQAERGRLQEEVEATGNLVIFYPKFHCELNFIERFWCAAKYYVRENCEYNLKGLRETVPKALDSVTVPAIFHYYQHCMRIMDTYRSELAYGTKQFTQAIYSGHRQVVDKSKW